jgi:CRP/FNR family transcriptional regulator, cyclic AMP receptor protein
MGFAPMDRVSLLSGSPLFEMLSNQELDAVCALLVPRNIAAQGVIFAEGALGDGLYLIAAGEVEVFQSAHTQPIASLSVGECFGEMALVDKEYRSATVKARTDVQLLHLSPVGLAEFRKAQKDGFAFLVMNIARMLSVRLREANLKLSQA